MFLDAGPAIIILGPILGPIFTGMGVDSVHFAIIMCVNLTVGLATPPMGLVLFVAAAVSRERVDDDRPGDPAVPGSRGGRDLPDHLFSRDFDDAAEAFRLRQVTEKQSENRNLKLDSEETEMFNRLIKTGLAGAIALSALTASAVIATAQEYTIRATANSNENDEDYDGLVVFKNYVENASNGKIKVDIFMGTQLCSNGAECLQGIADGSIDIYISTSGGAAGLFPYVQVLDLPYLMADDRIAEEGAGRRLHPQAARHGAGGFRATRSA